MTEQEKQESYLKSRVSPVNLTGQDLLDFLQSLTAEQLAAPAMLGISSEGFTTCLEKIDIEYGFIILEQSLD